MEKCFFFSFNFHMKTPIFSPYFKKKAHTMEHFTDQEDCLGCNLNGRVFFTQTNWRRFWKENLITRGGSNWSWEIDIWDIKALSPIETFNSQKHPLSLTQTHKAFSLKFSLQHQLPLSQTLTLSLHSHSTPHPPNLSHSLSLGAFLVKPTEIPLNFAYHFAWKF